MADCRCGAKGIDIEYHAQNCVVILKADLRVAAEALIDLQNCKGALIYTCSMEDIVEKALVTISDRRG